MKIYQIDAFTNTVFKGNPAAVVPLEKWLPTETLNSPLSTLHSQLASLNPAGFSISPISVAEQAKIY